ncbi:hypothetical protein AZE42_04435 [Rhizopogon vesiculosus]|uniref:Uncharacterized protein n=1 Tax=Rhizopogon vesiculosus TaxID=180088 RepID=A0A1J8Q2U9_9AGAM|nr:hypothetical protein AZE42_04435 [Rhizopogon vesiculosus]
MPRKTIHDVLWRYHPFAQLNKQAYQVIREEPPEEQSHVFVRIHFQEGTDGRRYNLPTANEIVAVVNSGTSVISAPSIPLFTMFFSFHVVRRAGILISPFK